MLKTGDRAPKFILPSADGTTFDLAAYRGQHVVVYFYPRDDTPGCTVEAIDFTRAAPAFVKAGASVVGVSKDTIASHCKFRDKHKLGIPLLSDPDLTVHKAYGAWGEKTMYGKKVEGVIRSTFLIGPDGKIKHAWPSVRVAGHVDQVLAVLQGGERSPSKAAPAKKAPAKKAPAKKAPAKKSPAKKAPAKRARA